MIETGTLFLVYITEAGGTVLQPWQDLVEAGTLIDAATGDDLEMIGWATRRPEPDAECAQCGRPVIEDPDYGAYVHAAGGYPDRGDHGHYADPFS